MGKFYSDKEREARRKQAGFQTTSSVIAAEREAREGVSATPIPMDQAEKMLAEGAVAGTGGEGRMDKIVRLLESIDRKLDGIGRIG